MDIAEHGRGVGAGRRSGDDRAFGAVRRRLVALTVMVLTVIVAATLQWQPVAGAAAPASVGALRSVACKPLPSDPPLEAPTYAQKAGASPIADGWWCQLPHATWMPANFVAVQRTVVPLPNLYGQYTTMFAPPVAAGASTQPANRSSIVVAPEVNGAVAPGKAVKPAAPPGGRKVALVKGISATVVSKGRSVMVTWPYPSSKVPPYLRAVASITVTGTGVPESVVLAVARHVKPD
jgi:hypothetical protein